MTGSVATARSTSPVSVPGLLRRWMLWCAAAEAVGMAAAAGAARYADHVLESYTPHTVVLAGAGVVLGGLVEGVALGVAQARALRGQLRGLPTRWYVVATVAMAGLGWAAGSVPSLTAQPTASADPGPAWPLMLVAGGLLGLAMGSVLGVAQAVALRGHVPHPWVWVGANTAAWTPAMAILMVGASLPSASWPLPVVLVWAMGTGAVAGAALGLVLGWHVRSLVGSRILDRVVLQAVRWGHPRSLARAVVGLRVEGRRSHRVFDLPVMFAEDQAGLLVAVGQAERKQWWRNLGAQPDVEVLRHERWVPAVAEVIEPGDDRYGEGRATYERRWPRSRLSPSDPLVRIVIFEPAPGDFPD